MSAHYAAHLKSLLEVGWSSREVVNGELLVLKCWNVALVLGRWAGGKSHTLRSRQQHTYLDCYNGLQTTGQVMRSQYIPWWVRWRGVPGSTANCR